MFIAALIRSLHQDKVIKDFALPLVSVRMSRSDGDKATVEPTRWARAISKKIGANVTMSLFQQSIQRATAASDPVVFDGRRVYLKEHFDIQREKRRKYRQVVRDLSVDRRGANRATAEPVPSRSLEQGGVSASFGHNRADAVSIPGWLISFLDSSRYRAQRMTVGERFLPGELQLTQLLRALSANRGRMTIGALARELEIKSVRLLPLLASARRLVNIDGQPVLTLDGEADTVFLDQSLLEQQFEVTR
jgi:hypothetical protein